MATMLAFQLHKMNTGKEFVIFRHGHKIDGHLRNKFEEAKTNLSFINRRTMRLLFHFVLDKIEEKFIKLKDVGQVKAKDLIEKAKAKQTKIDFGRKASGFISKIQKPKEE